MGIRRDKLGGEILTLPTAARRMSEQDSKGISAGSRYCSITLSSLAQVSKECGAHGVLVFTAVVSAHDTSRDGSAGFTIRQSIQEEVGLSADSFSRALRKLETAGYLVRDQRPGCKPRIQLTDKGKRGLVPGKGARRRS